MTNEEREQAALGPKLVECPLCGSKESENHELCFHCVECGYLQCADHDGTYNVRIKA